MRSEMIPRPYIAWKGWKKAQAPRSTPNSLRDRDQNVLESELHFERFEGLITGPLVRVPPLSDALKGLSLKDEVPVSQTMFLGTGTST